MVATELKHLKTGDAFPELPDDQQLRLFTMRFCPYAQRAHLVLDAKQVPYHVVNIHLKQKPEWLTTINPASKVPTLQLTNEPGTPNLSESLIIAEYLNDKYPQRPLYPADAFAKATDRQLVDNSSVLASSVYRCLFRQEGAIEAYFQAHDTFEAELKRRGTKFFGGAEPGMVDYMVWPWIERRSAFAAVVDGMAWDSSRFAKLIKWSEDMLTDRAVQNTAVSTEVHTAFVKGHLSGTPDYDILVKSD